MKRFFSARANLHKVRKLQNISVGEDITLLPITESDVDAILHIVESDKNIRNRVTIASKMKNKNDGIKIVHEINRDKGMMRYTIWHYNRPIGLVSFWRDDEESLSSTPHPNDYGFGYFLDPKYRGQGIVWRSVRAVMNAATSSMFVRQFISFCEDDNEESIAVLIKLGFKPTDEIATEPHNQWRERKYVYQSKK